MENLTIQSVSDKKSGAKITKQVFMASGQAQSNSGSFISNLDSLVEENSKMASQNLNRQEANEKEFNNMNSTRTLLQEEEEDRKSTRLNSSHVRISYAVFCL